MRDDLRRHLERTHNSESMMTDASMVLAIRYASSILDIVEAALRDELDGAVPPVLASEVRRRVLDKIIYGVTPMRADIQARQDLLAKLTTAEERATFRMPPTSQSGR
jgi:hypothetical protein